MSDASEGATRARTIVAFNAAVAEMARIIADDPHAALKTQHLVDDGIGGGECFTIVVESKGAR